MLRGRRHNKRRWAREAELEITSFMNLMIILVPVLLISMVFSHVTVLDLKLPDLNSSGDNEEKKQLELVIRDTHIDVNYPQGIMLKRIAATEAGHDFRFLSNVLQEVKRQLREKEIEKRDILILSEPDIDYQNIVSAMDTVRSFQTVVAANVVQAELFPEISLGDAPLVEKRTDATAMSQRGEQ